MGPVVVPSLGSSVVLTSVPETPSVVVVPAVSPVAPVAVLVVSAVALTAGSPVLAGSVSLVVVPGAAVVGVTVVAVAVSGGASLVPGAVALSWGWSPTMTEGTQAGSRRVERARSAGRGKRQGETSVAARARPPPLPSPGVNFAGAARRHAGGAGRVWRPRSAGAASPGDAAMIRRARQ
ncbi:hypothetical protein [Nannocystis pusilla]|uniref:hypothetical protein n=1 Tax=Nannocystis pusilla TaxID=889268 RepID=UPI003B7B8115